MTQTASCRLVVLTALLLVMISCRPYLPPATPQILDPELERLLVNGSLFPSGWYLDIPPFPYYWLEGAEASAEVQFRLEGSYALAQHTLFRYRDVTAAAAKYHQMPGVFFSSGRLTPWEPPTALPYQSPVADHFQLRCADISASQLSSRKRITLCNAMGQYGKYLSIFSTWISPDGMQLEDLERILKAIDERMAQHLKDDAR